MWYCLVFFIFLCIFPHIKSCNRWQQPVGETNLYTTDSPTTTLARVVKQSRYHRNILSDVLSGLCRKWILHFGHGNYGARVWPLMPTLCGDLYITPDRSRWSYHSLALRNLWKTQYNFFIIACEHETRLRTINNGVKNVYERDIWTPI